MLLFCAGKLLEHHLAHRKLLDLAGHGGRKTFDEPDVARDLVMGETILTEAADRLLVERGAGPGNDPGSELLSVFRAGHPEHLDILNIGMSADILFDFTRIEGFSNADNYVLYPAATTT